MANYNNEEYCDMHFFYGAAFGNRYEARRLYAERFPNRQLPSANTFYAVHNRLRETGKFDKNMADTGRERILRSIEFEENVLQRFEENPHTSTRSVGRMLNASKDTVWRVLKEQQLYPFHLQRVQALEARDYPLRRDCCRWFLHKITDNPDFLKNVLFTDECSFNQEGMFNSKNSHVWAQENPNEVTFRGFQHRFSINVWAGILGDNVVGPYIFPQRLTAATYLVFLIDVLPELLENIPLEQRMNMYFQHDGAPAHFGEIVRNHLNATCGQQWIGRGGPTPWPPRSPDLTPLDFYFWGRMKELVYATPVENAMDLAGRIVEAAAVIQENNNFAQVRRSLAQRFTLCNENGGGHFEQLL